MFIAAAPVVQLHDVIAAGLTFIDTTEAGIVCPLLPVRGVLACRVILHQAAAPS
jgi:hypothetical protein